MQAYLLVKKPVRFNPFSLNGIKSMDQCLKVCGYLGWREWEDNEKKIDLWVVNNISKKIANYKFILLAR